MWLWDSNIVRAFWEKKHPTLHLHLDRVSRGEIALPSIVVAEILGGRCDFARKASPEEAPLAHRQLFETQKFLAKFEVVIFDERCAEVFKQLKQQHKTHKRHADMMIAAMAKAGNHIVVTRNLKDFKLFLPSQQLENWIDDWPA